MVANLTTGQPINPLLYSAIGSVVDGLADELKDLLAVMCEKSFGLCCMNSQRWNVSNLKLIPKNTKKIHCFFSKVKEIDYI